MPTYDYDCASCGRRFEVVHGVHAERPTTCPLCGGGPIRKAVSAPAVHFKGSGWAKKERRAAPTKTPVASGSDGDSTSSESKGEGDPNGKGDAGESKDRAAVSTGSHEGAKPASKHAERASSDAGVPSAKPAAD